VSAVKTRTVLTAAFVSVGVVVVGWQAVATAVTPAASTTATTGRALTVGASSGLKNGTYTGDVEQTRYGTVQVQITVASGKITDVTALALPSNEGRSVQINSQAAPLLRSEVLASQSASVQSISGATFTSVGYLSSLQSALDKAS
jgi:uncharacterized protein with FMN-binding domain